MFFGVGFWDILLSDAYSEASQTANMKRFAKAVDEFKPLTTLAKQFFLDVWRSSEYAYIACI